VKFDPKKTIFLIDGSSFLYRAYYGTRPLHTSKGIPVNAVYSFCRMIKRLMDKYKPAYMAIVWDSKGPTLRHEMFQEYKSTRQAPPSDLFDQKEYIQEFAQAIGMTQLSKPGYEADDLMYAVAKEQLALGNDVVMITSDKDMGQALMLNKPESRIYLYDAFKDELLDEAKLQEKFGFGVDRLPLYFALLGDSSDNIPGVRGVGKKSAMELAQQFSSLEQLYENLDQVKSARTRAALEANKQNAFLSRDLFLLQYTPTELTLDALSVDMGNWALAHPLFKKLEFQSLLDEGELNKEQKAKLIESKIERLNKYKFRVITTPIELAGLVAELEQKKEFAVDTETDGLMPLVSKLVGISLCTQEGTAYYVPCGHNTGEKQLSLEEVRDALAPIFADTSIKKYLHNAKFDMHVLENHGMPLHGVAFDSLLAASLVTKDWQRIGLKNLSVYYFDEEMLSYEDVVKAKKYKDFSYVPIEMATMYSAFDAHQTYRLTKLFEKELVKEGMDKLFYDIEMPLSFVLYAMERTGIYCDAQVLATLLTQIDAALLRVEQSIINLIGIQDQKINLNSPKQIEKLLFYDLDLPPQKKSIKRTGYSTDQEVLEELAKLHPVPGMIIKYRELYKLKSTYIEALPLYINPKDHSIHTTFSQTRAATGRLASFDPNMQNIPASEPGVHVRKAFKPAEGNIFISADYSQIELRVLAHFSQDKNLIQAFLDGRDIHRETAAHLFELPFDQVTNEQRQVGKRINFSILYGLTPYGLSKDLDISFSDAKKYIDKYFAQYPQVHAWMESVVRGCEADGYVTTLWGRRRYIPGIHERNKVLYEEAKRVAINTVAQGTAAEIMKQGMLQLDAAFKKQNIKGEMLLQIHDELLISVPAAQRDMALKVAQSALENVVDWKIPLKVDMRTGNNWKEVSK
jgi:DNA polymerase-1